MAAEQQPLYTYAPTHHIKGPSTLQVLAVVALLPLGVFLLTLATLTLIGTVICLTLMTPLFIIFSPVLVPAAITIGLAVAGFITSGAFGLTGLTSLAWILKHVQDAFVSMSQKHQMYIEKRRRGK